MVVRKKPAVPAKKKAPAKRAKKRNDGHTFVFRAGLARVEWSAEERCWHAKLKGLEGTFAGPSPCEAADKAVSAVNLAFEVLQAYGVDVTTLIEANPHLAGGLIAFKEDINAAHNLAHTAADTLKKNKREGRIH